MLTTLLLLSLLTADPDTVKPVTKAESPAASAVPLTEVPANFQAYFERAEARWTVNLKARSDAIEKAEVVHRGAPANQKATQRRKINDMKSDLADMKKDHPRDLLPAAPKPDDIGITSSAHVYAVLDDKTIAVKATTDKGYAWAIMKLDSTKGIKTTTAKGQKPYNPHGVVFVTAEATDEDRDLAKKFLPLAPNQSVIVLQAIKPAELAKMRTMYEASKKQAQ